MKILRKLTRLKWILTVLKFTIILILVIIFSIWGDIMDEFKRRKLR